MVIMTQLDPFRTSARRGVLTSLTRPSAKRHKIDRLGEKRLRAAFQGLPPGETAFQHLARRQQREQESSCSRFGFAEAFFARKNNFKFAEFSGLCIDLYQSGMLLDDNVVTQRETKTRSLAGWFGREERIEHFFPHFRRNAAAVV